MGMCTRVMVLLVLAVGCDGGGGNGGGGGSGVTLSAEAERACSAVEACEGAAGRTECEMAFGLVVAPAGCLEAVEAASCEDHAADESSYTDTCFPPCAAVSQRCNSDGAVTKCDELGGALREVTLDCVAVCAMQEMTFSGVCGVEYSGQRSSSGEEVCWCTSSGRAVGVAGS